MQIHTYGTLGEAAAAMHHWLSNEVRGKTLLLLSGGSAAPVEAAAWQMLTREQRQAITITLTDERYGKPDHKDSNWTRLQECGFKLESARHIPVLQAGLNPEETAARWCHELARTLDDVDKVLAVLGVGTDKHIVGIKPGSPVLTATSLTSAYSWDDFERITITPAFFPHIASARIFANGPDKRPTIDSLEVEQAIAENPSQLIKQTGGFAIYYVA